MSLDGPEVLVVGAGAVGLAVARELGGSGFRVEILERARPGRGASWASAGMIAPESEDPGPGPLADAFRASRALWPAWHGQLVDETGIPVELDRSGTLWTGDPEGGLPERHLPDEMWVDNRRLLDALLASCLRRGVVVTPDAPVERVLRHGKQVRVEGPWGRRTADRLVLAAGAWSGRIGGDLPSLPLTPVKGQMLRYADARPAFRGMVRHGEIYVVPRGTDDLLVGATVERAGFSTETTDEATAWLRERLHTVHPELADREPTETWAGLRPGTPDGLPLLGPLPDLPEVVAATGHSRHGILLLPWTASVVAETIVQGRPPRCLAPFSPERLTRPVPS